MSNRRKFIKSTSLIIASAGALGYHTSYSKNSLISMNLKDKKGMVLHNVYFWLKESVSNNDKKDFEKGVNKFLNAVDEIETFEIGIPADTPDRDVVDKTFGYSIFVWFKNVEDHNVYQKHPAHEVFINNYSSLWAKVQVLDSEVI